MYIYIYIYIYIYTYIYSTTKKESLSSILYSLLLHLLKITQVRSLFPALFTLFDHSFNAPLYLS